MGHQPRDEHLDGGPLHAERPGEQACQQEEQPELLPEHGVRDQEGGAADAQGLGDQDQLASLDRVGQRAADQAREEDREQLGDAQQADDEG